MKDNPAKILIVDDEQSMCEILSLILGKEGYAVDATTDARTALSYITQTDYDLVIQDVKMPGMNGIELLRQSKAQNEGRVHIIMTAYSSWNDAVEAMRLGAFDYIKKPFDNAVIKQTVARALLTREFDRGGAGVRDRPVNLVGCSPAIKYVTNLIEKIARTDSTVLIQGESGTGKELVARALHLSSLRADQPFIAVNCGAFTESLLESELFGHVKGAFTGAISDKKGMFELADKGTLFLDEVGEMSPSTQVKFLRVLEEREFSPVGGQKTRKIDVRVIAATNRVLTEEIREGNFREDLYYRLNVIPVFLPPLRERREDIPLLAGHLLARFAKKLGKPAKSFSPSTLTTLVNLPWPGNVRELDNIIHRAVALTDSEEIQDLGFMEQNSAKVLLRETESPEAFPPRGLDLEKTIEGFEKRYIEEALRRCDGNMTNAAKLLNMTFRSIRYKVKKYGIEAKG